MPGKRLFLVVGLGNPGDKYGRTRHNAGFMVIDELSEAYSIELNKNKFDAKFGRGSIDSNEIILAKPLAYMNRSGPPVRGLADYFRISTRDILIIHDDIDLVYGNLKIKTKGGHGGHNGVRSIIDAFGGENEFIRVRVGIGRSGGKAGVTDHVLGKYTEEEKKMLDKIILRARNAVVTIICEGSKVGMNKFNTKSL